MPRWILHTCRLLGVALGFGLPMAACSSVPELDFVDPDSGTDGAKRDSGADPDGSSGVCPDEIPPGIVLCCDHVPCAGDCDENYCAVCKSQCGSAALCCMKKNGQVRCAAAGSSC